MIRDGDGKDREELAGQLCGYYEERSREDLDSLPRVTRKNVLVLKYYSFENYFLNPQVMTRLGTFIRHSMRSGGSICTESEAVRNFCR